MTYSHIPEPDGVDGRGEEDGFNSVGCTSRHTGLLDSIRTHVRLPDVAVVPT